jgi:two-component system sensor histidine kinase/response regulator
VSIQDTGIGISKADQDRLFQSFVQADASTTRRFGGTGLGLAISRQLVDLMGGEINVESQPGIGSTFWFTLQLPKSAGPHRAHLPSADLHGVRVLAVDDVEVNRLVLHEQLSGMGLLPVSVASGTEALDALRSAVSAGDPFRLAVIDYLMPGMDGLALAAAIKAEPAICDTQLILLASLGRRGDGKRFYEAGFAGYLVKPAALDTMSETLSAVWARAKTGRPTDRIVTRHLVAESRAAKETLEAGEVGNRTCRVLVAEDNIVNQKVAKRMLENLGCRVDLAANGV